MKNLLALILFCTPIALFGQTTWYEIQTGTNKQLNVIEFASADVGFIGGNDSLLLKTTDGGASWDSLSFTGVTFGLGGEAIVNLKFVSETIGYMTVGPYSGSYKTTDGGLTWSAITFTGTMCYNQGMYFFSEDNGAIGGSGCFQGEHIEMMNAGVLSIPTINTPSWTAQDIVLDIDFEDANFGLAVSESRIVRTIDGGATWDTIPHGYPDILLTSIEIMDDTLAYAGYIDLSSNFGLLMTTDAGLTWTQDINTATFAYPDYHDVAESGNGNWYTAGTGFGGGAIFEHDGVDWTYYNVDQTLRSIASYNDSVVFSVGDSGYVVTNVNPILLSTVEEDYAPPMMELYPNPANDVLNFVLAEGFHNTANKIVIWNLAGQEIMRSEQSDYQINISGLEAGMYVIEVATEKNQYVSKFQKN